MSSYRGKRKRFLTARSVGAIAIYGVVLAAILFIGLRQDRAEQQEEISYGSLEGRFTSDIFMEYQGEIVYYRENEIENYLLIGMDREGLSPETHQDGGQADFLLVLSVDRRNRCVTPVMIDRDTMAKVPTYGIFGDAAGERTMQICLAQAYSGRNVTSGENTARAVSQLLHGVKIDHYAVMDLDGIVLLNDAVGGVEVTLEDDLTVLDPVLVKGATVCLTGDQAEHFVRGRMTVADGTNASRMNRQQAYLESLVETVRARLDEDPQAVEKIWDSLSGHVETDMAEKTLFSDVDAYGDYEWKALRMLPGVHKVGEDGFAEFWPEENGTAELTAEIWFR